MNWEIRYRSILYCFFTRLPLADAAREAGTLDDPITVLTFIDNNV